MHESLLAQAALPQRYVVLGLLLRPYSLGHELYLLRQDNAVISEEPWKSDRADLAEAVFICANSFRQNERTAFEFRPWTAFKIWIWKRRTRKLNTPTELLKFVTYRNQGCLEFPLTEYVDPGASRSTPREPGSPFLIRLYQFLRFRLGMSHYETWDCPFGWAKQQFIAYWEAEGGLNVYNRLDAEHDKFVAQMEAEEKSASKN